MVLILQIIGKANIQILIRKIRRIYIYEEMDNYWNRVIGEENEARGYGENIFYMFRVGMTT